MKLSLFLHARNNDERETLCNNFGGINATSLELICSLEDMIVFQGVDVAQSENQSEQRARSGPSRKKRKLTRLCLAGEVSATLAWRFNRNGAVSFLHS